MTRIPIAPFPFPLKLLAEAEGEEVPDDDDDVELPEGVDADPLEVALDTEPDLENGHEVQGQACNRKHARGRPR